MKQLWSPWRVKYVMNHEPSTECIFCKAQKLNDGPENLIVIRNASTYAILNRYPYTSGHLMIAPFAHQPNLECLDAETRREIVEMITMAEEVLDRVYHPEGFNIGANIGSAAGAGVVGHLHFHVVPRWGGDTNFMSTLAETRVLAETLEQTLNRLKAAWPQI
ncbi:MAG: HIT domain-containing protein [Anaerolineaceae bacterium]|nr:HIT domain-containing protein [Anaerolineaceae bacterium]